MDASIVDGFKSECGSVAAISDIEHPISLARYVLDNFPNSIVVGEGARKLTEYAKLNLLSKGNMTAPMAVYLASDKSKEIGDSNINLDVENHRSLEVLESKLLSYNRRFRKLFSCFFQWCKGDILPRHDMMI